jgi:hypothetical protein
METNRIEIDTNFSYEIDYQNLHRTGTWTLITIYKNGQLYGGTSHKGRLPEEECLKEVKKFIAMYNS